MHKSGIEIKSHSHSEVSVTIRNNFVKQMALHTNTRINSVTEKEIFVYVTVVLILRERINKDRKQHKLVFYVVYYKHTNTKTHTLFQAQKLNEMKALGKY